MNVSQNSRARPAFTLIELMVTIAIVLVLVSLIAAVAWRALAKGDELRLRNEITQLSLMVQTFQSHFGVDYVPSRIKLAERKNTTNYPTLGSPGIDTDSVQFLLRLFPRMQTQWETTGATGGIDWNGDGTINTGPAGRPILE